MDIKRSELAEQLAKASVEQEDVDTIINAGVDILYVRRFADYQEAKVEDLYRDAVELGLVKRGEELVVRED